MPTDVKDMFWSKMTEMEYDILKRVANSLPIQALHKFHNDPEFRQVCIKGWWAKVYLDGHNS